MDPEKEKERENENGGREEGRREERKEGKKKRRRKAGKDSPKISCSAECCVPYSQFGHIISLESFYYVNEIIEARGGALFGNLTILLYSRINY